jgi:hypothetical protein
MEKMKANDETLKSVSDIPEQIKQTSNVQGLNIPTDASKHIQDMLKSMRYIAEYIVKPIQDIAKPIQEKIRLITDVMQKSGLLDTIKNVGMVGIALGQIMKKTTLQRFETKQRILKQWENLEKELKTQNRYFPKSELINILKQIAEEAKCTLRKGSILYRARKIEVEDLSYETKNIIDNAMEKFNEYESQNFHIKEKNIWQYIENIPIDEWNQYENKSLLKQPTFWGFDAKNSDAPTSENSTQGRANPIGISYLYTSRNAKTAIAEIQPTIEQTISLAKIKTLKKLNLFSFDFSDVYKKLRLRKTSYDEVQENLKTPILILEILFDTTSELFSKPYLGNTDNYYVTQYVSEFIKSLGFDGIKYKSSLRKNSSNIVLFDTSKSSSTEQKNYEILSSSLHRITNVKTISKKIFPRCFK